MLDYSRSWHSIATDDGGYQQEVGHAIPNDLRGLLPSGSVSLDTEAASEHV